MTMPIGWTRVVGCAVVCAAALAVACGDRTAASPAPPATAAASAPAPPASQPAHARPKVVILGDSLTAGLGVSPAEAYPALLQQRIDRARLRYEVVNAGVSGDTSAGGLRRLDWSLDGPVRVLVLALGANDGLRGLPVAEMKKNLATIIDTARARHVTVILAGMEAPPNYGAEYAAAFRKVYRDLAAEYRVPFVPFLLDKVAGRAALNQADGIHPNPEGAAIVADTVWAALQPVL